MRSFMYYKTKKTVVYDRDIYHDHSFKEYLYENSIVKKISDDTDSKSLYVKVIKPNALYDDTFSVKEEIVNIENLELVTDDLLNVILFIEGFNKLTIEEIYNLYHKHE